MTNRGRPAAALGQARREFDRHWDVHEDALVTDAKILEAKRFLAPVTREIAEGRVCRVLDVGCGNGVHAKVLAQAVPRPVYWAVDLSMTALRQAQSATNTPGALRLQLATALALPFADASFDAVFAYGVVAYTGDAERAVAEMIRVCRPGGLIGLWVYPQPGRWAGGLWRFVRAVCRGMGPRTASGVCHAIVPFLSLLPVRSGVNLRNSSWRQCAEIVEVNLLPSRLDFFSEDEVVAWLERRGAAVDEPEASNPITVWARVGARMTRMT